MCGEGGGAGRGAGRCCCVRGLVMRFPLVAAGGEVRGRARQRGAGAVGVVGCLHVVSWCSGPWGVAQGGGRVGVALLWGGGGGGGGGQGWVLCRLGIWVSRRALWAMCVCVGLVMRPPAGPSVEVGGGCLGFWVGLRFIRRGWLLLGGTHRQCWRLRWR